MNYLNDDQLISALNWRYAVKKFDSNKKIKDGTWQTLEQSLILTPSSYGLQPWNFYVVTNPDLKTKLTSVSWNQKQVEECSHLVVFTVKTTMDEAYITKFVQTLSEQRNTPAANLDGYKKMMVGDLLNGPRSKFISEWASRQTYIALGNFMTCAALLGVDTCPMEGIQPEAYDEILGIKNTGYKTVVACVAGYRSTEDAYQQNKKVRFSKQDLIIKKS